MNIAKRLVLLVAVPLAALAGLGVLTRYQLERIEQRARFAAESRIHALATVGRLSRAQSDLRLNVWSYALATTATERADRSTAFTRAEAEFTRLLQLYADSLVFSDEGRVLLASYQRIGPEWIREARRAMALADQGRQAESIATLNGPVSELGRSLNATANQWIRNNEELGATAGR